MNAYDVMSVDIVAAIDNASVIEVATRIVLGAFNGMPVVSEIGRLVGVVTTIDILRAIREGKNLNTLIAKDIMSPSPATIKQATKVEEAIDIMDKSGIMMVPVVEDDGRLIGVCSRADVLKEILNEKFVTIGRTRTFTTTVGEA